MIRHNRVLARFVMCLGTAGFVGWERPVVAQGGLPAINEQIQPIDGLWDGVSAEDSAGKIPLLCKWEVKCGSVRETVQGLTTSLKFCLKHQELSGEIDIIPNYGPNCGLRHQGIYKIEQNRLSICTVRMDQPLPKGVGRPDSFFATTDHVIVLVFHRAEAPATATTNLGMSQSFKCKSSRPLRGRSVPSGAKIKMRRKLGAERFWG